MYCVELYAAVRLSVVDEGLSHHETGPSRPSPLVHFYAAVDIGALTPHSPSDRSI